MRKNQDNRNGKKLWMLILIALLLRLIPAIFFPHQIGGDDFQYNQIATSLAEGKGYSIDGQPTAVREPVLPFLTAITYRLFGQDTRWMFVFQAILGAVTVLLVYWLGQEIFSKKAGGIAAILTAIYPNLILYTRTLLTETLVAFFLTLFAITLIKAVKDKRKNLYLVSGLSLGLLTLTKASFLFLPLFVILFFLVFYRKKTAVLKGVGCLFVIYILIVGSWTIRNYQALDKVVPVVSRGGAALFHGVYIPYNNFHQFHDPLSEIEISILGNETEVAKVDERYYQAAKNYVLENPGASFLFYLKKMVILWYGPADAIGFPLIGFTGSAQIIYEKPVLEAVFSDLRVTISVLLYVGVFWLIMLLALYALWEQRKNALAWMIAWPVIYGTLFYPLFLVTARYKEPLLPLVFVLAGYGWEKRREIWRKYIKRSALS